jgi:hypothetical protein
MLEKQFAQSILVCKKIHFNMNPNTKQAEAQNKAVGANKTGGPGQ